MMEEETAKDFEVRVQQRVITPLCVCPSCAKMFLLKTPEFFWLTRKDTATPFWMCTSPECPNLPYSYTGSS